MDRAAHRREPEPYEPPGHTGHTDPALAAAQHRIAKRAEARALLASDPVLAGELLIGGIGLSRGYVGLPELTCEKFLRGPPTSPGDSEARLYRTGDLCRVNESGDIEFLGRIDGQVKMVDEPALTAINMRLRDDYVTDCAKGVERWNKVIEKAGIPSRLKVPHKAFHRNIGALAGVKVSPDGRVVSEAEWNANVKDWLPTAEDRAFVASLMGRVAEPGKFANWIAPPVIGINRQPIDFEYVRFN